MAENDGLETFSKWKYSFYSLIIFVIVATPAIHTLFGRNFTGNGVTAQVLRALLFFLIIRGIMDLNI